MSLADLYDQREATIARRVVDDALAKGYAVSVYDCAEWTLHKSRSRAEILAAMATTDDDRLAFYDETARHVGTVWLIYGNGSDLCSDWTDNPEMSALLDPINDWAGDLRERPKKEASQ